MLAQEFAMGYNCIFEEYGHGADVYAAAETWLDGDRDVAMNKISGAILEDFTVYGTPEECRVQIAEYHHAGVVIPVVLPLFSLTQANVERLIDTFGEYVD